jgi:hypothetical protein
VVDSSRGDCFKLQYSLDCKDTFPCTPIIGYRRGQNLKDILVHTHRDLRFQVIECCHTASDPSQTAGYRKRRELFWIWEFKTITPAEINHMV